MDLKQEKLKQSEDKKMRKFWLSIILVLATSMFANSDINNSVAETNISVENNSSEIVELQIPQITPKNFKSYKIEVLVEKRIMKFYGLDENKNLVSIKQFVVATPKTTIKYPSGIGHVVKVELDPWWYPTAKTRDYFKKHKNIHLPNAVCPGDKQNYMGPFKITLSNSTKERGSVYRIHGNVDDSTIGKRASGGCVRMHNGEGKEFAILVRDILKQGKQISVLYI
jgi:lipoprotein-anchoring transpeptidase ErfK/SrfK